MKICILSMQRIRNFGSLLQAYSLKIILEDMGHDVAFIDIQSNDSDNDNELLSSSETDTVSSDSMKKDVYRIFRKLDRNIVNRLCNKRKNKRQNLLFERFSTEYLKLNNRDNENHYDICIIGSDEVFNCMTPSSWGFTSQLFGNVSQASKIITYAASCGATTIDELPQNIKSKITEAFENITSFSVRDKNTKEFVSRLTNKSISINLDPVAIMSFDKEIKLCSPPKKLPDRYCIVYSYYNRMTDEHEISYIKTFCKKNKMKIIAIGAPQLWIDKYIVLTPFEMLSAFKKAAFVITDTFHGTIFSAKYSKHFAVMIRPSNKNKLYDLICRMRLEKHLLQNPNDLLEINAFEKNNIEINGILKKEKENTLNYLRSNLV